MVNLLEKVVVGIAAVVGDGVRRKHDVGMMGDSEEMVVGVVEMVEGVRMRESCMWEENNLWFRCWEGKLENLFH